LMIYNSTAANYELYVPPVTLTENSTGTVYPFTHTFGGGSSSDGEL